MTSANPASLRAPIIYFSAIRGSIKLMDRFFSTKEDKAMESMAISIPFLSLRSFTNSGTADLVSSDPHEHEEIHCPHFMQPLLSKPTLFGVLITISGPLPTKPSASIPRASLHITSHLLQRMHL